MCSTLGLVSLWNVMFLIGMFVHSTYKWGFYTFALLTYFFIAWQTMGIARSYASRLDPLAHRVFTMLSGYELFLM